MLCTSGRVSVSLDEDNTLTALRNQDSHSYKPGIIRTALPTPVPLQAKYWALHQLLKVPPPYVRSRGGEAFGLVYVFT